MIFVFAALQLLSYVSAAQQSLLMGRITDDQDNPVRGAIVHLSYKSTVFEVRSDDDGMFYTQLLPTGNYHLRAFSGRKDYNAGKIYFVSDGIKRYYLLKMKDARLNVVVTEKDVFAEVQLNKVNAGSILWDLPVKASSWRIMREDSAGMLIPRWGTAPMPPRMPAIR